MLTVLPTTEFDPEVERAASARGGLSVIVRRVVSAEGVLVCAFAAIAMMTLAPAWNAPGWPMNHDGQFAQRVFIYARHFVSGDFLPIWSSADASGFGSPMPLFYHRLFYIVAAFLSVVVGSIKIPVLVTLALCLVAGGLGMQRLTRELGCGPLASAAAGASLIAANYTVTNWLVRGAVAEMTAAMLVPWLLLYFNRALTTRRMPVGLGVTLALVWHAHSVIGVYAAFVLAVTWLVLASIRREYLALLQPAHAWRAVTAFVVLVAPMLIAMAIVAPAYDLTRFLSWPLHPSYQLRPLSWYFWDRHWQWGHTASGLTLQIDLAVLALFAFGLAVAIRRGQLWSRIGEVAPVLLPAVLCLMLQMHWAEGFYIHVPGAAFVQFPWRLLGILTPALIAAVFTIADRTLPEGSRSIALAVAATWMVAGSGAFVPLIDGRVSLDPVSLRGVTFSGYREYEPAAAPPVADLRAAVERRWSEVGCQVSREDPDRESVEAVFSATCDRTSVVPLPIYASVLHRVRVSRFDRVQSCAAVPGVPAVCGVTLPAGQSRVRVALPSMTAVAVYVASLGSDPGVRPHHN